MFIVKTVFQITVFRMEEGSSDIDLAILTALLKGETQGLMQRPFQLSLRRVNLYLDGCLFFGRVLPVNEDRTG